MRSAVPTSNKGLAEWGELLGDTVIASATLDRLLHHSHVARHPRGELPAPREAPGCVLPVYPRVCGGTLGVRPLGDESHAPAP